MWEDGVPQSHIYAWRVKIPIKMILVGLGLLCFTLQREIKSGGLKDAFIDGCFDLVLVVAGDKCFHLPFFWKGQNAECPCLNPGSYQREKENAHWNI